MRGSLSDSPNITIIENFLTERHANFVSALSIRPSDGAVFAWVPVKAVQSKVGKGGTSYRQMAYLRRRAKAELGIDIVFLIQMDEQHEEIEGGLRALLESRFPGSFSECFISFSHADLVDVWIDAADSTEHYPSYTQAAVETAMAQYLGLYFFKIHHVFWARPSTSVPSLMAILRTVKVLAPATLSDVAKHLENKGLFMVPSHKWVRHQLDRLRRQGLIVCDRDDTCALTERGLSLVPSGRGRASSDVEHALALTRRLW